MTRSCLASAQTSRASDPTRRAWLLAAGAAGLGLGFCGWPLAARAGQLEEPLADPVRLALRAAIASSEPPLPVFSSTAARLAYLRWLTDMSDRLRRRKPDFRSRIEFLQTVWYETRRAGLDTTLVMGLIQVESAFRKFAISRVGARGYMQIMPFWSRLIGDGDVGGLFNTQINLRFGCVILRHYLDRERGNTFMALGRYNGSRGRDVYPNAVYAAARHWVHPDA
ncbi:lytic transglycosylase domain-containing protein [Hydrogenophaga sp.]|uniref:lytic transglycosylase domain-containing protein n=1 Tax=Hydrogenophaga sp. TaxID=1904254 RepID=UPI0019C1D93F|nr:lytic transglycosylase domain-containing protein [Hydrogenophaga sp.]MBD3892783.1 lytic transglycosylase domain-containing protein [Hydrogenophaga sp.]